VLSSNCTLTWGEVRFSSDSTLPSGPLEGPLLTVSVSSHCTEPSSVILSGFCLLPWLSLIPSQCLALVWLHLVWSLKGQSFPVSLSWPSPLLWHPAWWLPISSDHLLIP
jgi:hypothetical protein